MHAKSPTKQTKSSLWSETFRVALGAIAASRLRSGLTMSIIAIGIAALVGIFTAIDALKATITESFSALGAGTFSIVTKQRVNINGETVRSINFAYTTYDQAVEFKQRYKVPSSVSLSIQVSGSARVQAGSKKTNPNVMLFGADEASMVNRSLKLDRGRNFSSSEVEAGRAVALVGPDVATTLFDGTDAALGKSISIGGKTFEVVGVLASKGSGMGMGMNMDLQVLIPITAARAAFDVAGRGVQISVLPDNPQTMDAAMAEAEGVFRLVRRLGAGDESDFQIQGSDTFAAMLIDNLSLVTLAATLIGLITLVGAAIGLMNIMLVSVGERTREIGTRKALGARPSTIRSQFLIESILVSQFGGLIGVVLGILMGNAVSALTGGPLMIPWGWIAGGVVICLGVGVASGYLPAKKAAGLDPVEALRYE